MKNPLTDKSTCAESFENGRRMQPAIRHEQRLARAYKLGGLGWWEWDVHGEYIEASAELYEIYGINQAERSFSTGTYLSLVHPDDLPWVMENISMLWQSANHQYEHRIVKPSGKIVYVSLNVETVRDQESKVLQLHGIVQDITKFKKAEKKAKEAQKSLEGIIESIGDGFIAVDKDWIVVYWNGKAEQVTGKRREEALEKNLWELCPHLKSLTLFENLQKAMTENQPVHFREFLPLRKIWTEVSAYPSSEGLSVYLKDVTERIQLEEERKRVDVELQKTNEHLAHTLQNMSDSFCTLDRNWNFTFLNDRLVAMLGGTHQKDFLGKNLWACFPEAIATKFFNGYHKAMRENTALTVEDYYAPLDIWLEVDVYPGDQGLSFFLKDITNRKKYEKRLEFIAKASTGAIWEQQIDSEIVTMDGEKCKQLVGYEIKNNSFPRSFWLENIHPDDVKAIEENKAYALQHGLDFYLHEYRFKNAKGHWAWLKSRIYQVKNETGKVASLIGTIEDVTAKRISEKALMESEMSYRQLFNNNPLPTLIADANSLRILAVNTSLIEQYGYNRSELMTMTLPDLHPKEQHEKLMAKRDSVKSGVRNNLGTIRHITKSGEIILVEVTATSIVYKGQDAILATAKNVTERERLRQAMVEQKINHQKSVTKAVLNAQERERSEIGKELHDNVSQLIATAKLYVENVLHCPEENVSLIDKGVALLNQSITEIRRLSHVLVAPAITATGFKDTLFELIQTYNGLNVFTVNYSFAFVETAIDKSLKLTIYRILQEQFHNTVKHAKASVVLVEIKGTKNSLRVNYEDNGVGFDPRTAQKGIGLKNIATRIDAYQGKLKIKSSPGHGYKMEIFFRLTE